MSVQLSIFDEPPMARASDPATSHAAAASAKQMQGEHHRTILACLEQHGPLGKRMVFLHSRGQAFGE